MGQALGRVVWTIAFAGLAAGRAEAAGFALREQSATAQGNAFAGATAGADDLSYMFFNPAALGRLDGYGAAASLAWVAPRSRLEDASATTAAGTPAGGRTSDGDVAEDVLLPAAYLMLPLGDRVRLGLGVNSPFGLRTDYPDDWVGRYHADESELETVNVNPAVAVRVTDWLSVGAGLQAQYARGRLTQAIDFGTAGAAAGIPGAVPGGADGRVRLKGDDWSWGYDLGLLLEPVRGTRFGVAYRSEVDNHLDGRARFTDDGAGIAAGARAASGAFASGDAELDVTTPASLSFGVHQDLPGRVAVMAEAQWTDWSSFEELRVRFDNPAQRDSTTRENWHDTWFFALGATWKPLDNLTLRTGVAYDQSPTTDRYRTPRIPDGDRYWLSFGLGWSPLPWLGLNASYAHVWVEDSKVELDGADPGNRRLGGVSARYDNSIDIVSANVTFRF